MTRRRGSSAPLRAVARGKTGGALVGIRLGFVESQIIPSGTPEGDFLEIIFEDSATSLRSKRLLSMLLVAGPAHEAWRSPGRLPEPLVGDGLGALRRLVAEEQAGRPAWRGKTRRPSAHLVTSH
jgi:hypothetical protein